MPISKSNYNLLLTALHMRFICEIEIKLSYIMRRFSYFLAKLSKPCIFCEEVRTGLHRKYMLHQKMYHVILEKSNCNSSNCKAKI